MGLERLTSILQNVRSNYDSDAFTPIFQEIQKVTGARPYTGKLGKEDVDTVDMAYRVIADHVRTMTFAITDGAVPGNEGRNYVLRRILRRAVRYGTQILKAESGFLSKLVKVVVDTMKDAFPEIAEGYNTVIEIVKEEESAFEKTIHRGLEMFKQAAARSKDTKVITGSDAFSLYDTYGYPVDLTQLMAEEQGYKVDMVAYEAEMNKAKERSREAHKANLGSMQLDADATSTLSKRGVQPTDDSPKFLVQDTTGTIKALYTEKKEFVDEVKAGDALVGIVLDRTNFYAEQGGQIYDIGVLSKDGNKFEVENVQTYAGFVLHMGKVRSGSLKVGDTLNLQLDQGRRAPIMSNHTSTHVLNFALRSVLKNPRVDQKGSLVDAEKLRFDFAHNKAVSMEEIEEIEKICSDIIAKNLKVFRKSVPLDVAKTINGVRAVFGETYPDPVTVVSIGKDVDELLATPTNPEWMNYSVEFCGGTHITSTSDAKHFVVITENGIAKGVRRIIAWTGDSVKTAYGNADQIRTRIAAAKTKQGDELDKEIAALTADLGVLPIPAVLKPVFEKDVSDLVASKLAGKKDAEKGAMSRAEQIVQSVLEKKTKWVVEEFPLADDRKAMSAVMLLFKEKCPETATMLFSKGAKTVYIMAAVPKVLHDKIGAGDWARDVATVCGGKGGGKADAAQASGELSKFDEAFKAAQTIASSKLQ
jgi:alanyl-tRNA synthetase